MQKIAFSVDHTHGNRVMKVRLRTPDCRALEEGQAMGVIQGEQLRDAYHILQAAKLQPDKGPYADSRDDTLAKAAWQMKKAAGRNGLEAEIRWLIDVLIPRALIYEDSMQQLLVPDIITYLPLACIYYEYRGSARMEYSVMTAGRLTEQTRVSLADAGDAFGYIPTLFPEEIAVIGAGVLRAAQRDVFLTKMISPDDSIRAGLSVFPDESTIIVFFMGRYQPPICGLDLLSDPAAMSGLAIRSAENRLVRDVLTLPKAAEEPVNGRNLDAKIGWIRERIGLASSYWPENPQIPSFLQMLEEVGGHQKKRSGN